MRPLFLALFLAAPLTAQASCVVVDAARDNLSPDERKAARVLLEDALRDAGQEITDAPCGDTWTLHHTRLGSSITARVSGRNRSDSLAVTGLEELPVAYTRLVDAVLHRTNADDNAGRDSVISSEEEPPRRQADSLATLRVGWGILPFSGNTGPALGGGTRFELDKMGIDLSFDAVIPTEDISFIAAHGRISGLFFIDPAASATPFGGLGLGIGGAAVEGGGFLGVIGSATIGYSFLRETSIRLIPQVDAALPLGTTGSGVWTPWASVTLGVAYVPFRAERRRR